MTKTAALSWASILIGGVVVACGSGARHGASGSADGGADPLAFGDANADAAMSVCAAQVSSAQRAVVDIVVVIDGSGSMLEETEQVQNNLNAFADSIGQSGLDYQVLMIADKRYKMPFPIGKYTEAGICVPPPLGGPGCTENPPKFRMVAPAPDSTTSLQTVIATYSSWKQYLRPEAFKVFIEITDDESTLAWQTFDQQLLALPPQGMFGTPANRRYVFDSICGWQDGTPPLGGGKCSTADATGDNYQHLSILTHGTIESVCKTSYDSVFGNLAKGVVATLGCSFTLPTPASGTLDPGEVVVEYTAGGAAGPTPLVQVTEPAKCAEVPDAWYFDDNATPTHVVFCPGLCDGAGADTSGKLEIALGCMGAPPR